MLGTMNVGDETLLEKLRAHWAQPVDTSIYIDSPNNMILKLPEAPKIEFEMFAHAGGVDPYRFIMGSRTGIPIRRTDAMIKIILTPETKRDRKRRFRRARRRRIQTRGWS